MIGVVGRVGLWEVGAAQALFADAPEVVPAGPPTCTFHPTFLSRSAPGTDLAVMEITEHSGLFFVGNVHQIEICKGDNVDAAPQHCPSVAAAQVFEGWRMVNHMSM